MTVPTPTPTSTPTSTPTTTTTPVPTPAAVPPRWSWRWRRDGWLAEYWCALFVLGGALLAYGVMALLPPRLAVWPRGGGALRIQWQIVCPALAACFGVPALLGRVLTRPRWWFALGLERGAALALSGLLRVRPRGLGGGATLGMSGFVCCALAGLLAWALADEVLEIARPPA